jgi:RNA polymerase sigma factor (sigma-70 family)
MMPANDGGTAAAATRHITPSEFPAFYVTQYPKLVKILVVMGATLPEAEDAAQQALKDLFTRVRTERGPSRNAEAYVCVAAIRHFLKQRARDRERLPRELLGRHLTLPVCPDDDLAALEGEQWVEHVLASLTPAQRDVIRLVMEGASTREIAGELGKTNETVRQLRKTGRDRLKDHPEIAPHAPRELQPQNSAPGEVRPAATSAPRKGEVQ